MYCFIVFPFFLKYLTNAEYISVVDMLHQNLRLLYPIISSASVVPLESRMLDNILYVVDKIDIPLYLI